MADDANRRHALAVRAVLVATLMATGRSDGDRIGEELRARVLGVYGAVGRTAKTGRRGAVCKSDFARVEQ